MYNVKKLLLPQNIIIHQGRMLEKELVTSWIFSSLQPLSSPQYEEEEEEEEEAEVVTGL